MTEALPGTLSQVPWTNFGLEVCDPRGRDHMSSTLARVVQIHLTFRSGTGQPVPSDGVGFSGRFRDKHY